MSKRVVVGIDGSEESMAAARWAGEAAVPRGAGVHLVNVWQAPVSNVQFSPSPEGLRLWEESRLREAAKELADRHPTIVVTAEQVSGTPAKVLLEWAAGSEMVVLGSHGLGAIAGFMYGSVGLRAVARADQPVVLVRSSPEPGAEEAEIVLGVDLDRPCDALLAFAFEEAAAREAVLRVVHVWDVYRAYGCAGPALDARFAAEPRGEEAGALERLLQPWRAGFPDVSVTEEIVAGRVMEGLLDAARTADLLIIGRRRSHAPKAMHIGPVTHGLVHHAECAIAVVSHD